MPVTGDAVAALGVRSQIHAVAQCVKQAELKVAQRRLNSAAIGERCQCHRVSGEHLRLWIIAMQQTHRQLIQIKAAQQGIAAKGRNASTGLDAGERFQLTGTRDGQKQWRERLQ